ncbi:uncharacterized protein LOC112567435 [Pomacea canaliculata]|uniref:uncharacterized protein LOC112567435 n=1 Tax=Pomacea canaliculata TaxID=400727 RepID=UPI000D72F134|nr:uncharacterized protein LOC112567435 [Pomacea canaliculata]
MKVSCTFVVLSTLTKGVLLLTCGFPNFDESLSKEENSSININYTINITASPDVTDTFNADYQVCEGNYLRTACIFIYGENDIKEFKKDVSGRTGVTCYWEQRHVSSSLVALDIYISQVVTRSLSAMIISTGRGGDPKPTRLIRVEVLYPPNVTSLTVDGGDNVIIDKGQVVNVSCFFEKGNPPAHFYLLDKNGTKLNSTSSERHLSYSLTARCEDDWPVVRCEGNGSQQNKSVTILVKCKQTNLMSKPSAQQCIYARRQRVDNICKHRKHASELQ